MTARRPGAGPLLRMRDYIYNSLYDSNGYFQAGTGPVLPRLDNAPSLFSELPNQKAYHEMVAARFRQKCSMGNHVHGWLTPVELFSPFLSRAIANRIVRQHGDPNQPLHVVEIGGGSGSLCSDILDYLADTHDVRYTIVEISPVLAKTQQHRLQSRVASNSVSVVCQDILDFLATGGPCHPSGPAHFIACEVLDNFAHDLVRLTGEGDLLQAWIDIGGDPPVLHWEPCVDEQILTTMASWGMETPSVPSHWVDHVLFITERLVSAGARDFWIPVQAQRLLSSLALGVVPIKSLTIMDFAKLPGALPGTGSPIVQRVDPHGSARVYPSVVAAPYGSCDIMFPVSFEKLERAFWSCFEGQRGSSRIMTQSHFFSDFACRKDLENSTCLDGYNPVLSQFSNASVFTADLVIGEGSSDV